MPFGSLRLVPQEAGRWLSVFGISRYLPRPNAAIQQLKGERGGTRLVKSSPKYWAFVSYSHHDARWGRWLHAALETYRVPRRLVGLPSRDGSVPERIRPVFIDREELPTSSSLSQNIGEALQNSRYLIVICSPHAAVSTWVNEEIRRFKMAGGADRVLCLIVSGEPNASDKPELGEIECFPEAVRYDVTPSGALGAQRTEPIAADLRKGGDGPHRAKMKLIAGVLGVNFDDLMRREQRRRTLRNILAATAAVVILAVIGSIWYQGHRQTLLAEQRQNTRLAQLMFQKAQAAAQQNDDRAAALYGAAWIQYGLMAGELAGTGSGDNPELERKKDFVSSISTSTVAGRRLAEPNFAGAFAASPDGEFMAWSRGDGTIIIATARDSRTLRVLRPKSGQISTLALTNGGLVAAGSRNGTVALWSRGAAAPAFVQTGGLPVRKVAFASGEDRLAAAGDGFGVRVWDIGTNSAVQGPARLVGEGQNYFHDLAFSPDGRKLGAVADGRGGKTLMLWDSASGKSDGPVRTYAEAPESLAFSPDGRWMAVGLFDSTIRLSSLRDKQADEVLTGHQRLVGALAFSPDSRLLASGSDDWSVSLWDVTSMDRVATLNAHARPIVDLAFANGGRSLLSASSEDHVLQAWTLPRPFDFVSTAAHSGAVRAVAWDPGGAVLASAGDDRAVRLWNASTLQPLPNPLPGAHADAVRALAFAPKGEFLVSAGRDGRIVVWDWRRRRIARGPVPGHDRWIFDLAISRDGRTLATASWDKSVKLWSLPDLRFLGQFRKDSDSVGGVAFSSDGRLIASASNDHAVRLWDLGSAEPTGQALPAAVLSGHSEVVRPVVFSPGDGSLVSGGGDGRIKFWNVRACLAAHACRPRADLMGHHGFMVWTLAFSPDGALLASGSQSNDRQTLRLWDVRKGRLVAFLTGHRDFALTARFSPDGRMLASGGSHGDLRLWRVRDFWPLPQRRDVYDSHLLLNFLARPPYDLAAARLLVCRIGAANGLEIVGTDALPAARDAHTC